MSSEHNINAKDSKVSDANPADAEPGRGAPGDEHYGVQMAQNPAVSPPEEAVPGGVEAEKSEQEVAAVDEQEAGTGVTTTSGYTVGSGGELNNVAVEPPVYVEE